MTQKYSELSELSRRQFIINSTGTGFAALLLACGISRETAAHTVRSQIVPAIDAGSICALTPQKEEGPFFIEGANIRKNIRDNSLGKNLLLKIQIVDVSKNCQPVQNAIVNIWHCDASGIYSGYEGMNPSGGGGENGFAPNGMPPPPRDGMRPPPPRDANGKMMPRPNGDNRRMGPPPQGGMPPNGNGGDGGGMHMKPTSEKRFLRGVQVTDSKGQVEFETVYPGWYAPRAVHIHTKIFLNDQEMLTTQMFFPEKLNDRIFSTLEPYKARGANPNKTDADPIAGDDPPILTISEGDNLITGTIIIGVKSA